MIGSVTLEKTTYNLVPHKFEAGAPNIAGAIGLAAALEYVRGITDARVDVVWDPPWTPDRMSEAARLQFGI